MFIRLGAVYVYKDICGTWILFQILDGYSTGSRFGIALVFSPTGNQLVVGAHGASTGMTRRT